MLKPEQIEDLRRIAAEIKSIDHVYGSGLMTPFGVKVNSSRAAMTYQQLTQAKNLDTPEIARVSTGYEKVYGDRSTSFYESEKKVDVVHKIQKFGNDSVYVLITREKGTNHYDLIERKAVESFAESSGVKINNEVIDKKKPGSIIDKGEILYRSTSYDEDMNYRLGVNAKTLYMVSPFIIEDAVDVSNRLAEKLRSTSVQTYTIPKNTNDVFLNTYGTKHHYKVFPDIGEKVKDRTLCVRRRIDYNNAQYLLKGKNLRKEMHGDTAYYTPADAEVVDIDIYCNTPFDELPRDNAHAQINKYLDMTTAYWQTIYDTLSEICGDEKNTYSDNIGLFYARARDVLSIGKRVKWKTEVSIFDNMIITITIAKSSPAMEGSKLVGRHGNKCVISRIVPDDQMPVDEDGNFCDIQYNAQSVIARLNQSQSYEPEMNWIVDEILKGKASKEVKFESLMIFLSLCNPDQEKMIRKFFEQLSREEKKKFLDEITTEFVTFQPPSKTVTFENYSKMIDKFKPKKKRFTIKSKDGTVSKIQRKLIMSDTYVYRLKHEPITKFSVRSKGTINPRTFLPIKSHAYSRGTALFNNQAIRLGTMEMDVLRLCNDPAAINYMTRLYCTSVVGRREFNRLLNMDIFSKEMQIDMENHKSRVVDMFNSTLLAAGYVLSIELGETEEIKNELMMDLAEMSKKNVKLVFKQSYLETRNK